jgi:hypothetical protein
MLRSTVDEVKEAFAAAKNLNAALKNLLKKEGSGTPQIVGFAKEFRNAASSGKSGPRDFFIEKNYPAKELFLMGAVRYAFPELIDATVGSIVEKFADQFNATYERHDNGIKVTDTAEFKKIAKEVHNIIKADLKAAEVPTSNFMQNALLATVFEIDVFAEVMKVLE